MTTMTRRAALRTLAAGAVTPALIGTAIAASHGTPEVRIKGFAFSPATLKVTAGTTVVFVNEDSAPHTATSGKSFDTGRLNKGQKASVTFNSKGTFEYACDFHPMMRGRIVVE